jgi:hypothetical protein
VPRSANGASVGIVYIELDASHVRERGIQGRIAVPDKGEAGGIERRSARAASPHAFRAYELKVSEAPVPDQKDLETLSLRDVEELLAERGIEVGAVKLTRIEADLSNLRAILGDGCSNPTLFVLRTRRKLSVVPLGRCAVYDIRRTGETRPRIRTRFGSGDVTVNGHSAIDDDALSGHERSRIGCQEHCRSCYFVRLANATKRRRRLRSPEIFGILP